MKPREAGGNIPRRKVKPLASGGPQGGGQMPRLNPPKVRRSPVVVPPREVAKQAPKVRPRHAPNVFTESPIRNPIEKIQTKQARQTAKAVWRVARQQQGVLGNVAPVPKRPLTNREAARVLNSVQGQSVLATVPKPKKKGKGFSITPAGVVRLSGAVLSDIPKELAGKGAVEGAITRIGATSAKGWEMVPGVGHEIGNVVKDTTGVVAGTVPSIALPIKEVATGHPGRAGSMIYKGIKETVTHPLEHPVSLALIARGGEGAISRGAGELVRHSPSKAIRDYGSLKRPPISLGGSALHTRDATGSKGLIENRVQKALDRRQARKQGTIVVRKPYRSGEGKLQYTAKVTALRPTKRQLTAPHILGGKLNRRIDTEAGKHNVRVRDVRTLAGHTMAKAQPSIHEDAVALVNEGVLKRGNTHRPLSPDMARQDLQRHLDQLTTQRASLKEPSDLAYNREQIAQVERLLGDEKFMANPKATLKGHFKGARSYADALRAIEPNRVKYGDLTQAQVLRRPLLPFAAREMGLRFDENTKKFVDPKTGSPVSNKTITDAFVRRGGDPHDLAYVPALDRTGASNFYGSGIRRPGAETKNFTGASALAGTYPRSFDALSQHLTGSAMRVARHESVNNLVNSFGLKQANGKYFDTKGAKAEADNIKATTGEEYIPVTAARQKVPEGLLNELTPEQMQQTFHEAEPGDSHVVLFPRQVWDRLQQHESIRAKVPAEREIQRVSQAFRHAVLLVSTKWLAGNSFENYLRMQINELTPVGVARTIQFGRKFEKDLAGLGPLGAQRSGELHGLGAPGMFKSQKLTDMMHPERSAIGRFAHAVRTASVGKGKISSQIGPNGIANLWDKYAQAVTQFNGLSELMVHHYGLGKAVRNEIKQFQRAQGRAIGKAGAAYEAVLHGALDSDKIAEYAQSVDDVRGRYANLSPNGRWFVTTLTPFAPWYVNSLHFFAVTLPGHHPLKTGLLAAAAQGTAADRKKLNLPPWAQGVPLGNGRVLPLQNFLPTGITSQGLAGPTSLILPQVSGLAMNAKGLAWTGRQLPKGTSIPLVALNTAAGTFLPFYSKIQTVLEKGGTSAPDSTLFSPKVKPGTGKSTGAGIVKVLNPMRTQSANPPSSSASVSGWGSAAGSSSGATGWGTAAGSSSSASGWGSAGGG